MPSKKILLISRCPPYPLHLGDRLIIWHLARQLKAQGYTLDLCALTQSPQDEADIPHYESYFHQIRLFPERPRTALMYLQRLLGAHFPVDAPQAWQPDMWKTIAFLLTDNDYDVVHLFGGVHVYEFAHLLRDHPTIITPYESYSLYLDRAWQQNRNLMTLINRTLARQFERWMFSPYDVTTVLTEQDAHALHQLNPQLAIDVIPNGIDLDTFVAPTIPREKATLLFVGNYAYPPNHDAALLLAETIFPQVQVKIPDAQLWLVGNAPTDAMRALASDSIHITGRVPSVQDYLAKATVFVCPLRVGAGIKNKVLEALAMQIPTVATPLSMEGIAAQHGEHALIAPIEAMANTITSLLQDTSLQKHLSGQSRALIEKHYSWVGVARQYVALYERVSKN